MHLQILTFLVSFTSITSAYTLFTPIGSSQTLQKPLDYAAPYLSIPTTAQTHPFWTTYALCPAGTHWGCHYFKKVYCACFTNGHPRPLTAAAAENTTALEILAEVLPGNNATLLSVFTMRCPDNMHVECRYMGFGGPQCGCFWNLLRKPESEGEDVGADWGEQEPGRYSNTDAADEEEDKGGEGDIWLKEDSMLAFRIVHWPRCPLNNYWTCCLVDTSPPLMSSMAEAIPHTPPRKVCFCVSNAIQDPCPPN